MDNKQPPMNQPVNQSPMYPHQERSVGPVIGLVVILVIIVIGGIYFWHSRQTGQNPAAPGPATNQTEPQQNAEQSVDTIKTHSSSDDVASINADLNNFNQNDINSVDTELK